jgi:hypothetical protein
MSATDFQNARYRAFLGEARASGVRVLDAVTHQVGEVSTGDLAKTVLSLAITRSAKVRITDIVQYYLSAPGVGPVMFFKPFSGRDELPGELHAVLPGGLAQPICLAMGLFGSKWATNDDAALARRLKADGALAAAVKRFKWVQFGARGETRLEWGAQLRTMSTGASHLVMQSATYGSVWGQLAEHGTGLDVFLAIAAALAPMLTPDAPAVRGSYFEAAYNEKFFQAWPELEDIAYRDARQAM